MEIKILQVFYDKNGLPYKDKERQVHFPIVGNAFQCASNTTKIRFYYNELDMDNETTFVAVSKLPNGKIGSKILNNFLDEELNENYALLELDSFYTQVNGDLFISLQGYQGGVRVEQDEQGIYQIYGTPTIQATGSIKLSINYATQFVGSGEEENVTLQRIFAYLGTKLGIRATTELVSELPTVGQTDVFYAIYNDPQDANKLNIYVWNETTQEYVWVGDNTLDLGDYYTQEQGEEFEQEIDTRVSNVENELSSVASGSPSGVYADVSALTSAYPTGNNNIYVCLDTGDWYYWNTTTSQWTSGGTYLSSEDYQELAKAVQKNITNDVTLTSGFRSATAGTIEATENYSMVRTMPLYKGEGVRVSGYGYENYVAIICEVDKNGNYIRNLVVSDNTSVYEYVNTSKDVMYVDLSFANTYQYSIYVFGSLYLLPNYIYEAKQKVDDVLIEDKNDINGSGTWISINISTSVISSSAISGYLYTDVIELKQNAEIFATAYGFSNGDSRTAIICLTDKTGNILSCAAYSNAENKVETYHYKNQTDDIKYVRVCYAKSQSHDLYVVNSTLKDIFVSQDGNKQLKVQNAEFLDVVYSNLFDGDYVDGYVVQGQGASPSNYSFGTNDERYNLVIIPVKPNTKYTIGGRQENNIVIFRAVTATSLMASGQAFDGAVLVEVSPSSNEYITTITTGANDHYLYLYGLNYTSPTRPFVQICEGEIDHFTTDQYSDYYGVPNKKLKLSQNIEMPGITIQKISSTQFNVIVPPKSTGKSLKYIFQKIYKKWDSLTYTDGQGVTQTATNVVSCNYWNNYFVYDEDGNYVAQGNSNFIAKESGAVAHIGDGHGNEVLLYLCALADGVEIDIDNMENGETISCSSFKIIERTNTYRCGGDGGLNDYTTSYPALDTSGNPVIVYRHNMEMSFEIGNEVTIHNQLVFKQNGITFDQLHGAMLQCYYGDFTDVITNNIEGTRNEVASDGTCTVPSDSTINLRTNYYQKCNRVEMFGGNFYVMQEMLQDDVSKNSKSNIYFDFYPDRLKCYFQPAITGLKDNSWGANDVFNIGDQISVTNHRIIVSKKDNQDD